MVDRVVLLLCVTLDYQCMQVFSYLLGVSNPLPSFSGVCDVIRGQAGQGRELDQDESPLITLGPLERKSCGGDELSDGVQSMDVR